MKLTKEQIKSKLDEKLTDRLAEKYKDQSAALFENDANANINLMKDKVDSLRRDVSDLEIRRRNTKNDTFKKTTGDEIDSKRAQARAIQKSIKSAQTNKATKAPDKDKKAD